MSKLKILQPDGNYSFRSATLTGVRIQNRIFTLTHLSGFAVIADRASFQVLRVF